MAFEILGLCLRLTEREYYCLNENGLKSSTISPLCITSREKSLWAEVVVRYTGRMLCSEFGITLTQVMASSLSCHGLDSIFTLLHILSPSLLTKLTCLLEKVFTSILKLMCPHPHPQYLSGEQYPIKWPNYALSSC